MRSENRNTAKKEYWNRGYLFLPFLYRPEKEKQMKLGEAEIYFDERYWQLAKTSRGSDGMEGAAEIKYLLRYVTDKMNPEDPENCLCCHYVLNNCPEGSRAEAGRSYQIIKMNREGTVTGAEYPFEIKSIQLFVFRSGIGVFVYELEFEDSDPKAVSAAEYLLKKISRQKIREKLFDKTVDQTSEQTKEQNEEQTADLVADQKGAAREAFGAPFTLYDEAKAMIECTLPEYKADFFFFSNPGQERCNFFTYVETGDNEELEYDLFRLRNSYNDGFYFDSELEKENGSGIFRAAPDVAWGISEEAAACRVTVSKENKSFRHGTFFDNFRSSYLYMFVMLLHQKYVLYYCMTTIGVEQNRDEKALNEYKENIHRIEYNYLFKNVTEVPQYQKLYRRIYEAFEIDSLYAEVAEPVQKLAELRAEKRNEQEETREKNLNFILVVLAIFGIFSAMADIAQVIDFYLNKYAPESQMSVFEGLFKSHVFAGLFLIPVVVFIGRLIYVRIKSRR